MYLTVLNVFCMLDEPEFGVGFRRKGREDGQKPVGTTRRGIHILAVLEEMR